MCRTAQQYVQPTPHLGGCERRRGRRWRVRGAEGEKEVERMVEMEVENEKSEGEGEGC